MKEKYLNITTQVVRLAMKIVSKDVRKPKCVRDGINNILNGKSKKQEMESLFVGYEQALALKELGFKEGCIMWFDPKTQKPNVLGQENPDKWHLTFDNPEIIQRPTYSQAFRWLYQKLDIEKGVMPLDIESQQLLLKELIDKVSSKHLLV